MSRNESFIPIYTPAPQDAEIQHELERALLNTLRSGNYVLGPVLAAFEEAIASYLGVAHAIGVNSGTDALVLGLAALGIGPGDEVITSPFTFFGTAEAVSLVGATPRFVDIDPVTFNLDIERVEAAITPRTRCIIPVHLYGRAVDMTALRALADRHGLAVLEDVAQAFGARHEGKLLGSWGDVGAFSFYPSKNLGGFGDGGLITTNRDDIAARVRQLRNHGNQGNGIHGMIGYNSRLDAMQAAMLQVKLPHVARWNALRQEVAARYNALLADEPRLTLPEPAGDAHVFHQYTVRVHGGRRDAVHRHLEAAGVGANIYYPIPLHLQPPYRDRYESLPHAEHAAAEVLSLPIWPLMSHDTQERVAAALLAALAETDPELESAV